MATRKQLTWFAIAGLTLVLASILAFLYARTRGNDESSYFENVARLRQIKELDARWELDALKSKIGINADYDPLVNPLLELRQLQTQLNALATTRRSGAPSPLAQDITALDQAIEEKTRLVEHFKSHNAVLRNSLAFLPGAADDIRQSASAAKGGAPATLRRLPEDANQVLLASLVYNQDGSAEMAEEIERGLGRLAAGKTRLPADIGDRLDIFAAHARTVVREHRTVNGLLGRVAAVPVAARIDAIDSLLAGEQRQAAAQFRQDRQYLLAFSAVLTALLLYAAFSLIRSHAVIRRVNRQLQEANESLEQRVHQRTRELHAAQAELVATARQAGMAEIATNVLHNVGNVLNSVNVSASVLSSQVRASKAAGLSRVVRMLDEHAADLGDFFTRDEKGKRLPDYLSKLSEAVASEQRSLLDEIGQLTNSVEHIKDIVATQQSYAGASRVVEPLQVRELVDDALRMNAGSLVRHDVTVVKEIADVPALPLDRHRVLQILVNLISNAKQAMDGLADGTHRLTLRVDMADSMDDRQLRISVVDEGEGIAAENLARIFNHGFTTRTNGHGFGLHSCALAAKEMGGILSAHSDGPGRGACFTLLLPIKAMESTL